NEASQKMKKEKGKPVPSLTLVENPDILATIGHHAQRPGLVVGFAAETNDMIDNARGKLVRKRADMIVANDVSHGSGIGPTGVMGGDRNRVHLVSADGVISLDEASKDEIARQLARHIAAMLNR